MIAIMIMMFVMAEIKPIASAGVTVRADSSYEFCVKRIVSMVTSLIDQVPTISANMES